MVEKEKSAFNKEVRGGIWFIIGFCTLISLLIIAYNVGQASQFQKDKVVIESCKATAIKCVGFLENCNSQLERIPSLISTTIHATGECSKCNISLE